MAITQWLALRDRNINNSEYIESVIQLGIDAGAMNEQYANYLRSAIPQLLDNQPSFGSLETWTNRHTMLAVANLMIVAKSFGVDSCPMEGFVTTQVKEAFNIPETVDVCCLLPMGYANQPIKAYGGRFEIEQVCYSETYGSRFNL